MREKNLDIQIKTQRLIICPLEMKFLDSTYAYSSDLENTKYMLFLPVDSREEAVEFLRSSEEEWQKESPLFYEFAMLKDGIHIGGCSLYLCDDRDTGELGWIVDKKYWRCGYASEAARAMVQFGAEQLGLTHFIAHCDSENIGSYRVMEKLGMKRTDCAGGRKNRSSDEERMEYLYELYLDN